MADVVIELSEGAGDNPLALRPRWALPQDRLTDAADEKWPEQRLITAMIQWIAVKFSIGRQSLIEHQLQHGLCLIGIAERGRLLTLCRQTIGQQPAQRQPGRRAA